MSKPPVIPDNEEIKRSLLEKFEKHRKAIVGGTILAAVLSVAVILYVVMNRQRQAELWYEVQQTATQRGLGASFGLEDVIEKGDAALRQNALLSLAVGEYQDRRYDAALATLDRFEKEYGDSFLAGIPSTNPDQPLAEALRKRIEAQLSWQKTYKFDNAEPDRKRTALVETSKGKFWIGFFPEYAPEHVENFVTRAKAGEFNATKVTAVNGPSFDFGGLLSRDEDPKNDEEIEIAGLLEAEKGRFWLEQTYGRISSFAYPGGESPLRVTVVAAVPSAPNLNKRQTVFAEVLRDKGTGLEAVDRIRNVVTYGTSPNEDYRKPEYAALASHPVEPIVIERVSIWSDGKIEEGHAWDTSAVTAPEEAQPPKAE